MTLELDELRSFLMLASELHFRKAAERLFVSQPALSKQVRKLEEKTGGPLFERTRRKVVLTEAGRVFIPLAERLLRDSQEALNRVRQAAEGQGRNAPNRLRNRVGVRDSAANALAISEDLSGS
jgi:DNA-binding transcriptional LysR family regulator